MKTLKEAYVALPEFRKKLEEILDKELENGLCPQHQTKPEFISEKNYFFRMSRYLPWLLEHIRANPDFIRPESRRNEIVSFVKSGLQDLSISRSTFDWGIPLPFDEGHVCYVWADALLAYLTGIGYGDDDERAENPEAHRVSP